MNAGFSAMKHCEQEGNLVTLTRVAEHASKSAIIWRRECMYVCMYTALVTHQYVMQMGWKKLHLHES
jgi:hypothetical protein